MDAPSHSLPAVRLALLLSLHGYSNQSTSPVSGQGYQHQHTRKQAGGENKESMLQGETSQQEGDVGWGGVRSIVLLSVVPVYSR